MNLSAVPKVTNPVLFDKIIVELQDGLKAKISWLNYSFGRVQKLAMLKDKKTVYYPAVHILNGEYRNLFPDDQLGNFSFFEIADSETLDSQQRLSGLLTGKFSLIVWCNLDNIYAGSSDRNTEAIKLVILNALRQTVLTAGRIEPTDIYTRSENVYKGYTNNEIDTQYLTQPYFGVRIEGNIKLWESC